ncbi:MAG: photosystem II protein Y [Cyanobacteria bacterium M5B4]|nr:photosystem II protein Y [Cyanobacteria bacterium KgW148]PLS68905.1 MAG: photosystem II protein Y [Cyanobacteria bacterium M5B4]
MDIDLRPVIVLAPIVLVAGWAAFNIISAAMKGEAKLFGARGNNPFAPENTKK